MKNSILVLTLCILLLLSAGVAWYVWSALDDVTMTIHGYIALAAGVVVSLLVGGGLMALVFYSARKGYDDAVDGSSEDGR